MTIVYGESRSGKTDKALSLLKRNSKSIYFSLDFDETIKPNEYLEVLPMRNCFVIDIEFSVLGNGKPNQIIIDPINLIRKIKNTQKNLTDIIERLKSVEDTYRVEIIAVVNTLYHFPKILNEIKKIKGVTLIEAKNLKPSRGKSKKEILLLTS